MKDREFVYPKGRFVFKKKPNAKGECSLYLQYTVDRKPVFRTTGIFLDPRDWDSGKQRIRPSTPDAARLNNILAAKKRRADELVEKHCRENGGMGADIMKQILEGVYEGSRRAGAIDFFQYAEDFFLRRFEAGDISYNTLAGNRSRLKSFRRFVRDRLQRDTLFLSEPNSDMVNSYKGWCLRKGNLPQTVNIKLIPIVTALKNAAENGLLDRSKVNLVSGSYYREVRSPLDAPAETGNGVEEKIHHLTAAMMDRLTGYYNNLRERSWEKDCLEIFFFSFHACGLRISDIVTLEWRHIDFASGSLTKVFLKNRRPHTIPLSPGAIRILRDRQKEGRNPRFVFDLLPQDFDLSDAGEVARAIDNKNRMIRQALHKIGLETDIPFPLGMHVARHTFAVMALNDAKVDVHLISRLLGHSSVLITEKVYARFLMSTLTGEMRERLSFDRFVLSTE